MTDISRRKVLAIIAAGVGSVAAKASGLMPEIAMARNADAPAAQGVTPEGNLAIEELDRDGIAQLIAEGQLNADTRALWQLLEKDGLRPQPQLGYGARAHLRTDPKLRGHFVAVPFSNGAGLSATVYGGVDAYGERKLFATRWHDVDRSTVDVFDVKAGRASRRSRVTIGANEAVIELVDGTRRTVRMPARRGPGLAAPSADCSVDGVWCALACETAVGLACWAESLVVCAGIAPLCPPCGVVCAVVTVIMCGVVTTVSCYYVCHPCG